MKRSIFIITLAAFLIGISSMANAVKMSDMQVDASILAQFGYKWSEENGSDDQLDTNRFRIRLRAMPTEGIMLFTQLEGTDNLSPMAAGSNVPSNAKLPFNDGVGNDSRIVDLYAVITYWEWATFIIGQSPSPVTYELNTDEFDLETIDYSQFVGIANRDRALAAAFRLSPEVGLSVWRLNGTGAITGAYNDIDDRGVYGFNLDWNAPVEGKLNLKVFGNFGSTSDPALDAQYFGGRKTEINVDAWGFGTDYRTGPFHLMGEYVQGKIDIFNEQDSVDLGSDKTKTWYLHGAYEIPESDLQLVLRYDTYDPDTGTANDERDITTLGMNYNFHKNARLQLMHEFMDGPNPDPDDNNTEIQLSVRY